MRRLREARASILRARLSLSAVSSSTELLAVLTSTPSFFKRSMTSWLVRPRSLASWKTLTFTIRLPSLPRRFPGTLAYRGRLRLGLRLRLLRSGCLFERGGRVLRGGRVFRRGGLFCCLLGRVLGPFLRGRLRELRGFRRRLLLGQPSRFFLLRLLGRHALRLDPRRVLRVAAVPLEPRSGGRLAD